jgi:redox-sensitive bicupin YhaK (pirin superfamily)
MAAPKFSVAHLDELETISGPDTLTWRPVRAHFDIRAFGTNAYTADREGADVVEPHTENDDLGHEELYFVARGSARFTIDGESFDAPTGTYVFIPEPSAHRHAVAAEAGTTVLSFGGPPIFVPSAWEWTFRAADLSERGELEVAREVLRDGRRTHPESAAIDYAFACVEALAGNREKALSELRSALDREPELAEWAAKDSDFESLRGDPEFEKLTSATV